MFCDSNGEEESLHRMVVIAVLVSALPLVAFFYSFLVWFVYAFMHEIRWTHASSLMSIFLRWILVVSSWVVSCGVVSWCGACGETIPDKKSWWWLAGATLLVGAVYAMVGLKLIVATRRKEVIGVDVDQIPFFGSKALHGKFIVVTGSNNGIGFETTRQLAAQGATIAMLCRNPKRANKAIDDIIKLQVNLHSEDPILHPTDSISRDQLLFVPMDLTDFETIRQAAKQIGQLLEDRKYSHVDSLVCNAGTCFFFLVTLCFWDSIDQCCNGISNFV